MYISTLKIVEIKKRNTETAVSSEPFLVYHSDNDHSACSAHSTTGSALALPEAICIL